MDNARHQVSSGSSLLFSLLCTDRENSRDMEITQAKDYYTYCKSNCSVTLHTLIDVSVLHDFPFTTVVTIRFSVMKVVVKSVRYT